MTDMVSVLNEQKFIRMDEKKTARLVRAILKKEGAGDKDVTVLVTGDKSIRRYNEKYFKKKEATDVIAFNADEGKYLGDVIVSAETALREHASYGATPKEELARYIVHGVLHLLGYRDKKRADFKKMHTRQEAYLRGFSA